MTGSLQSRVLVALVLVSMGPAIAIGYQGYHCGHLAVMDLMRRHVTSVVEARDDQFSQWVREREARINLLAKLPTLVDRLKDSESTTIHRRAARVLQAAQEGSGFEDLTLYDTQWTPVASVAGSEHADEDFLTNDFMDGTMKSDGVFYDTAHNHHAEHVGVHLGVRIVDEDERVAGYLAANLNLTESLVPLLHERSGLWETGKAYLVNAEMEIIGQPNSDGSDGIFGTRVPDILASTRAGAGQDVRSYRDFEGNLVIGTAMALPFHDWSIIAEIDSSEAMEWVDTLLFRASSMTLACLLVVFLVSFWLSRYLGHPLAQVASAAHRIGRGNVGERLSPMRLREAEEVRLAFNRMLDEMQDKEAALVQSSTLATVGELTSSIVHEMRNPLSSVKMNLQAISRAGGPESENAELTDIALTQVERLGSMLNELLHYGRPLELHPEPCTVQEIMNATREVVEPLAKERSVAISLSVEPPDLSLNCDKEQLTRALTNLVKNAVEASSENSEVRVSAGQIDIDEGPQITITVDDSGSGLPQERLDRLFRPFFTTKKDGVGLGLANVKKILDLHGGTIQAIQKAEGGATFELALPA